MILIGLLGVINCGDELTEQPLALTSSKTMGDSNNTPTQMMYKLISIS